MSNMLRRMLDGWSEDEWTQGTFVEDDDSVCLLGRWGTVTGHLINEMAAFECPELKVLAQVIMEQHPSPYSVSERLR